MKSLEETFEGAVSSLNAGQLERFTEAWHPEGVLITRNLPFPFDRADLTSEEWAELFSEFRSETTKISYTPVNMEFRVLGDVGIVWGRAQLLIETSAEGRIDQTVRHISTHRYGPAGWQILSWSDSPLPEGRLAGQ